MEFIQPIHRLLYSISKSYRRASDEYVAEIQKLSDAAEELRTQAEARTVEVRKMRENVERALARRGNDRQPSKSPWLKLVWNNSKPVNKTSGNQP
jgi:ElaB/YqjD/DUF883 family membrane-anchored ribosome-binding protein